MTDDELKARLVAPTETTVVVAAETSTVDPIMNAASAVMISYQNANKWLDIIKEEILMGMGCVFFSNYVHNLAHTMPVRFDKFGDILHTADIKIPYPATEYIPSTPTNLDEAFDAIFNILGSICNALRAFIKLTQDTENHGLACSTETLLNDIEGEYPALFQMRRAYNTCQGDNIKFDKWMNHYIQNMSNLLG